MKAAADVVRPAAEAKQIRFSVGTDVASVPITGDAERLQQVVWNLVMNAFKFTPRGGKVNVTLRRDATSVELRVSDDGQGIGPEFLPHVFERFRQADATTTRRHGGLGLGLALVQHLVGAHGGTVRAESEGVGRGAEFIVTLPLRTVVEPSLEQEALVRPSNPGPMRTPRKLPGLTALVVDDHEDAREMLATLLRASGMQVVTAAAAGEAIELIASAQPSVIVSDIGMPDTDGYALMRHVRSPRNAPSTFVPAIAVTAYAREEDRLLAFVAGFQQCLAKPVEPAVLTDTIARVLGLPEDAT